MYTTVHMPTHLGRPFTSCRSEPAVHSPLPASPPQAMRDQATGLATSPKHQQAASRSSTSCTSCPQSRRFSCAPLPASVYVPPATCCVCACVCVCCVCVSAQCVGARGRACVRACGHKECAGVQQSAPGKERGGARERASRDHTRDPAANARTHARTNAHAPLSECRRSLSSA